LHVRSCEWGMVTCVMRLRDDHTCHMYHTRDYHIFIRHTYAFISGFTYMYHTRVMCVTHVLHVCHTCVWCITHAIIACVIHITHQMQCQIERVSRPSSSSCSSHSSFLRKLARFPSMCSLDLLESTLMLIIRFREIIKTSTVCNQRKQELENGKQNWHRKFRIAKLQEP